MPERVQAVVEVPPKNINQFRAFLRMVNYYHRFLPNLSQQLAPLHRLLRTDVKWTWNKECDLAFGKVKRLMASETVLAHFNQRLIYHVMRVHMDWVLFCHMSIQMVLNIR